MSQGDRQLPPLFHQHSWYSRPADFPPSSLCVSLTCHQASDMGGSRRPSSRSCAPDIRSCRTPPASRTTRASRNLKSCTAPSTVRSLFLSIARVWSVYLCACACVCYACSYVNLPVFFFLLTICRRRVRSFARLLLFQSGERNHRYGLGRQPGEALCPQGQDFEICQDLDGLLNWRRSE